MPSLGQPQVLDAYRKLTAEPYVAEPVPGWSSVRSTIHHLALATEFHFACVLVRVEVALREG